MWWIGNLVGGAAGALLVFAILVGASTWIFRNSRRERVSAENVNDEWDRAAEITSPAFEHAPVTHAGAPADPDAEPRDTAEPTETKTH